MMRFAWLGVLWPALLLALPNVYDGPVQDLYTIVMESDTTYGDDRYAALIPGVWSTATGDSAFVPDPDSIGGAFAYYAARDPGGDSFIVLSYDTLTAAALDSAAVDSIWSDWQLGTPLAYALNVPGVPTGGGIDTAGALIHVNFDIYDSTQHYVDDPTNVWGASNSIDQQFLDTVLAPEGLTKSLRLEYSYPDTASFCDAQTIGRALDLPGFVGDSSGYREAWFEVAVRTDSQSIGGPPNWIDCDVITGGTTANEFAWKVQQIYLAPSTGYYRWQTVAGNCGAFNSNACWKHDGPAPTYFGDTYGLSSDLDPAWDATNSTDWNDETWHKMRYYIRMSSDSVTADGVFLVWQDTILVLPGPNPTDADTLHADPYYASIKGINFGRNKDKGGWYAPNSSVSFPWVETTNIGYITAWVAPDTPAWFSDVPIPDYAQ